VVVTRYVYDGWQCLAELDGNLAVTATYGWGLDLSGSRTGAGGVGGLLWVAHAQHGRHVYAYDGNGNVTGVTSATDGTRSAGYEYDPFGGAIRVDTTNPLAAWNEWTFSTKRIDLAGGVALYEHRGYDAATGAWLARDPKGERGGYNQFVLLAQSPILGVDPLGLNLFEDYGGDDPWTDTILKYPGGYEGFYSDLMKKYGSIINRHAQLNCVPVQLLSAIIAGEMTDYSPFEKYREEFIGIGQTLGPAQIGIGTAVRNRLLPNATSHVPGLPFLPEYIIEEHVRPALIDPELNIEAAARLLKLYIGKFCSDQGSGKIPRAVLGRMGQKCDLSSFCCRPACDGVFSEVPNCLIELFAAQWNYGTRPEGFDIWTVRNLVEDAMDGPVYQSWSMGAYTSQAYGEIVRRHVW
jgi:RHS repeat-associated protein